MKLISLFTGIGGLDLGLERAGMTTVAQVENDPYCQQVLAKRWPHVPKWDDITTLEPHQLPACDVIAGGFPCQPVSLAGQQKGQDDDRWLWPDMARLVRHIRPRYAIMENVPGLAVRGMGDVLGDLAEMRYDCEWISVPAAAVGAPHLRWRIFIVAYPDSDGRQKPRLPDSQRQSVRNAGRGSRGSRGTPGAIPKGGSNVADTDEQRRDGRARVFGKGRRRQPTHSGWWTVEPDVRRVAHGIPRRVDRLRGLGNAVVPQVAQYVGEAVMADMMSRRGMTAQSNI